MAFFTPAQVKHLRQFGGVSEDADAETIVAAVLEALDEYDDDATSTEVPDWYISVSSSDLAALEEQCNQSREAVLDLYADKYFPQNRAAWAKEYDRDPEGTISYFENTPVATGRPWRQLDQAPTSVADVIATAEYQNWS